MPEVEAVRPKKKPLAEIMIPRKYIDAHGHVKLWDVVEEGGPVKVDFTGILAREALMNDPDRYKLELPRGTRQGPLQDERDDRAAALAEEENALHDRDPVYGKGALR